MISCGAIPLLLSDDRISKRKGRGEGERRGERGEEDTFKRGVNAEMNMNGTVELTICTCKKERVGIKLSFIFSPPSLSSPPSPLSYLHEFDSGDLVNGLVPRR